MVSYIYIIGSHHSPYKIGLSKTPKKRLQTLQTGHPETLFIHYTQEVAECDVKQIEAAIHRIIKYRQHRGEWFDITLEDAISEIKFATIKWASV